MGCTGGGTTDFRLHSLLELYPAKQDLPSSWSLPARASRPSLPRCACFGRCRLSSPDQLGIPLALEEETQKYFPTSNSSKQVRDALLGACLRRGAAVRYGASLAGLRRLPGGGWAVQLEGGDEVLADRVVSWEWRRRGAGGHGGKWEGVGGGVGGCKEAWW